MALSHNQKINVYLEFDKITKRVNKCIANKKSYTAIKYINIKLDLMRVYEDQLTVEQFIESLTNNKLKKYYTELFNNK